MTALLDGRAWQLKAGAPGASGLTWGQPFADQDEPLQIAFQVKHTRRRGSNKATISLNNLSDASIGHLEVPGTVVQLSAGYQNRNLIANIFNGQIAKKGVKTQRGPDGTYTTTIQAGEAELSLQDTVLAISLGPGTDNRGALVRIATALGVTLYDPTSIPKRSVSTGWVYDGRASEALDELAQSVGADWSIQGNELQILKPGAARQEVVFIVSPSSGLLGIPESVKEGVAFTSYLLPALRPNRKVQVQSDTLTGLYVVDEVDHNGNWRQGPWVSVVKAREAA